MLAKTFDRLTNVLLHNLRYHFPIHALISRQNSMCHEDDHTQLSFVLFFLLRDGFLSTILMFCIDSWTANPANAFGFSKNNFICIVFRPKVNHLSKRSFPVLPKSAVAVIQ